jgi:hypothetical protein
MPEPENILKNRIEYIKKWHSENKPDKYKDSKISPKLWLCYHLWLNGKVTN